jgi:hypothetical protein
MTMVFIPFGKGSCSERKCVLLGWFIGFSIVLMVDYHQRDGCQPSACRPSSMALEGRAVILCRRAVRPRAHLGLRPPIVVKSCLSWEGRRGRWCERTRGLSTFLWSTSPLGKTLAEAFSLFREFPVWRLHPIIYTSSDDDLPWSERVFDPPDSDQGGRDIRLPTRRDSTSDFGASIWSSQE